MKPSSASGLFISPRAMVAGTRLFQALLQKLLNWCDCLRPAKTVSGLLHWHKGRIPPCLASKRIDTPT